MFNDVNLGLQEKYINIVFPKMIRVRQDFNGTFIKDIGGHLENELKKIDKSFFVGKKIGITAGSRGINGLIEILTTVTEFIKSCNGTPVIIPSMGSHGGANAEGQEEVLSSYGITREAGFEIISSMNTVILGNIQDGTEIHYSKDALECDSVILLNKIKPHADFKGEYESGLLKMACIGLGKHNGALSLHEKGFHNFKTIIPEVGGYILNNFNIILGIAIVENAFDRPMIIEVIENKDIMQREKQLLKIAKENMPFILSLIHI